MKPKIGEGILYTLTEKDAKEINEKASIKLTETGKGSKKVSGGQQLAGIVTGINPREEYPHDENGNRIPKIQTPYTLDLHIFARGNFLVFRENVEKSAQIVPGKFQLLS